MKITQISVFLENRKGRLFELCSLLGEKGINILALTIAETEDFGVLRIIVDKPDAALVELKKGSFVANSTDVVIAQIEHKPGSLANILKVLADNNINIEYMHAFAGRQSAGYLMVMRFDNPEEAIKILTDGNFKVFRHDEMIDF
jgi:hypothetical protein